MDAMAVIAAFGGGVLGAAMGAVPVFILTGLLAILGVAAAAGGGSELIQVAFGPVLGPHVSFGGGVAAAEGPELDHLAASLSPRSPGGDQGSSRARQDCAICLTRRQPVPGGTAGVPVRRADTVDAQLVDSTHKIDHQARRAAASLDVRGRRVPAGTRLALAWAGRRDAPTAVRPGSRTADPIRVAPGGPEHGAERPVPLEAPQRPRP